MAGSFSGMHVTVETKIFINPYLATERQHTANGNPFLGALEFEDILVPEGHVAGGVDPDSYQSYRRGLDSACADIVVTTFLPNGRPAVLSSKRAPGKLFGKKWWMQGGAIHSYRGIMDFIHERAQAECGVRPRLQGFIGVFRTCADDLLGSTINLCYVGFVPYDELMHAQPDKDHTSWRLMTVKNLDELPEDEQHWYPMFAFHQAIATTPIYK